MSDINRVLFSWHLEPGACTATPEIALCRAEDGLEGLSSLCQYFIRKTF